MCEGWGDGTGKHVPKSKASSSSPSDGWLLECASSTVTQGPTLGRVPRLV